MNAREGVPGRPARPTVGPAPRRAFLTDGLEAFIGLEVLDAARGRVIESNLVRAGTVLALPPGITWSEAARSIRGRTVLVPQELASRILSERSERPRTSRSERADGDRPGMEPRSPARGMGGRS